MQRDQIDIKSKATTEYLQMLIYYRVEGRSGTQTLFVHVSY